MEIDRERKKAQIHNQIISHLVEQQKFVRNTEKQPEKSLFH